MVGRTHALPGQTAVRWEGNGYSFRVFAHDKGWYIGTERVPPEEEEGEDSEGEEGGPGPP